MTFNLLLISCQTSSQVVIPEVNCPEIPELPDLPKNATNEELKELFTYLIKVSYTFDEYLRISLKGISFSEESIVSEMDFNSKNIEAIKKSLED